MLHAPREARTSKSHGCKSEEHCQAIMWPDLCLQNNIAGPTWIARPKTSTTLHPHWFLSELWHHESVWFSLGLPLNPPPMFLFKEKHKKLSKRYASFSAGCTERVQAPRAPLGTVRLASANSSPCGDACGCRPRQRYW